MRSLIWFAMAGLCMAAMFPALYTGMLLAADLGSFLWFPVPIWVCLGLMVGCFKWAEHLEYRALQARVWGAA